LPPAGAGTGPSSRSIPKVRSRSILFGRRWKKEIGKSRFLFFRNLPQNPHLILCQTSITWSDFNLCNHS
jgi:hypothetical protein